MPKWHLSAEEDYYRDPRRRPRFTFSAIDELLSPYDANLEQLMSSQDIRPDDFKKLNKGGIRTVGDVRKTGVDELTKSLGLHSSMRYALNSIIDSLPEPNAWARVVQNRLADPFRIRLHKDSVGVPPRWSEGNFQVEIEELESKGEGKKRRPFRIRIEGFDIDTSIMTLRPDQWKPGVASRWTELLDKAVKNDKTAFILGKERMITTHSVRAKQSVPLFVKLPYKPRV